VASGIVRWELAAELEEERVSTEPISVAAVVFCGFCELRGGGVHTRNFFVELLVG
jgi:hypothetical protein